MSTTADRLTREQWAELLGDLEAPAFGEVVAAIEEADMVDADPEATVDAAIDAGQLVEDLDAGMFGTIELARPTNDENRETADESTGEKAGIGGSNPGGETAEPASQTWREVDFSSTNSRVWAPAQIEREAWMCRKQSKAPYAPWGDADADVECTHEEHEESTTCAECDHHAGYKWGSDGSREHVHNDHATALQWADMDPSLSSDLAFIQREADPFVFVDGDNVRDPETGETHPVFEAFLEHLGVTYADVSTSESGTHAVYRGEIPLEGVNGPTFEIDDEPWGSNDELPAVEIYDGKHVCIATGDHVAGSGTEIAEWDTEAAAAILRANGFEEQPEPSANRSVDLSDHTPTATTSDETTDEIRDIFHALDRIDPKRVAERTIVREWTRGKRSFLPVWGSTDDNGTANYVDDRIWHDTGKAGGYGGPAVMAAIDAGVVDHAGVTPRDVSGETFFEAIDHLRDLGFSIPELERSPTTDDDADAVAAIGVEKLEALDPDDQRRAAKKRGHEIPTTREARQRLRDAIFREIRNGNTTVLDAPTALGKSYTVATEPWLRRQSVTSGAPVIHLHQTREARDEAASETVDSMATGEVLLGRKEASPVARGDHDPVSDGEDPDVVVTVDGEPASEWFDHMCDEKGLAFSTALAIARDRNDQQLDELPPFGEEDPAVAQWDQVPRDDDGEPAADVIHATHQFAHVPSMRTNTNIVLDEQPDFRVELGQDRIRRMVIAYLKEIGAPTTSFEAFVSLAGNDQTRGDAAAERDAIREMLNPEPESPATEWYVEETDAHALAPGIAKAIWNAIGREESDRNGRRSTKVYHEPPRFDADGTDYAAGTWLSVVIDDDNTIQRVRETPDLRQARAVVGLDAHPSMPLWELNAAPGMTTDSVLDPTERRLWRRFERGLTVVQLGEATRPRSGSKATEWMNDDRVRAVMKRLREHYGTGFKTALSTVQTERQVRNLLDEVAGGSKIDEENTMHFGEEKSRNDFADEEAGYVYGCMDPGDEMVLDTLAELGLDATPETAETNDGEEYRAQGRGFEGDDDETAAAVLASVRENHVAQAAGRYARNADEDRGATVYLHTDAAPAGFVDIETPGVEWIATDMQRDVIDELTGRGDATAKEIADAVGCSKRHVLDTLSTLEDRGLVERDTSGGYNGADLFTDDGATKVVVDDGSTTNYPLVDFSKWSFVVELRHAGETEPIRSSSSAPPPTHATSGGDIPPDRGD